MTESKFEEHNIKASILESFLSKSFKYLSYICHATYVLLFNGKNTKCFV